MGVCRFVLGLGERDSWSDKPVTKMDPRMPANEEVMSPHISTIIAIGRKLNEHYRDRDLTELTKAADALREAAVKIGYRCNELRYANVPMPDGYRK